MTGHNYSQLHHEVITKMLPQLLIAIIKQKGGKFKISVEEIDNTGQDLLSFKISDDDKHFEFEVSKKS